MTIDYTQPRVPPQQPAPPQPQRGWFARNWGWVVALGCVLPILLVGGCTAALVFGVFSAIRASDVYEQTVERAVNDPRVIEQLGAPVKPGWWVTGNINVNNDRGNADLIVPLNGTTRRGTLEVEASRDGGDWVYSVVRVRVKDGPVIDLAPQPSPSSGESTSTDPPAGQSEDPSSNP
jgi:hypothetical protein